MKKTHIIRIILVSLFTAIFIRIMMIRLQIDNYTLTSIILDMKTYGITDFSPNVVINMLLFNTIWIMLVTLSVICIVWYFVAMPSQLIPKIRFNSKPQSNAIPKDQQSPSSNNDLASSEGGDALPIKEIENEDIEKKVDKLFEGE